jgi:hypothetical protein
MNTTPEQRQTGPLPIRSVSSPSVKVIYLDKSGLISHYQGSWPLFIQVANSCGTSSTRLGIG